jgi:hypothetical protein
MLDLATCAFAERHDNVLIIDDRGLKGLNPDESGDLYQVVRRRYERGSTIITSNRAIEEWPPLFGNPLLASAAMDRLLHHAHILTIEDDSYRNPPPPKKRKASAASTSAAAWCRTRGLHGEPNRAPCASLSCRRTRR